jgi:hypothetical protein
MSKTIEHIADLIEEYGLANMAHPNDGVKLFAACRLVDMEIARRMEIINQRNKESGFLIVGGVKK